MAFCPTCRKTYDPIHSSGLCPTCGASAWLPTTKITIILIVVLAIMAIGYGIKLARGPRFVTPAEVPTTPPAPAPPTEFPAAGATIQPPREWKFDRYSGDDVAFTTKLPPYAALRYSIVPLTKGREAHLELIRRVVPAAVVAEFPLAEFPGSEHLAVRLDGDPRIGASWIIPRGESSIQILFWGPESRLPDVAEFWKGTNLEEAPR